jgi:IclR family transcriptional regulator, KDG regulon repressor
VPMSHDGTVGRNEGGVKAAASTLSILEAVALAREPIGLSQIARQLSLSKAGVFRYLRTLLERGYVVQSRETGRYRLGPKAYAISHLAPVEGDLIEVSEAPMRRLVAATGLTTVLGAPSPEGVIVMRSMSGTRGRSLQVWPGQIMRPFHALAHGKLILTFGPKDYRARVFAAPLSVRTPKTITDHGRLSSELDEVACRGYAVATEESITGVGSLAAPIFGPGHELVGSIALVSFVQDISAEPEPELIRQVKATAETISNYLQAAAGLAPRGPDDWPNRMDGH